MYGCQLVWNLAVSLDGGEDLCASLFSHAGDIAGVITIVLLIWLAWKLRKVIGYLSIPPFLSMIAIIITVIIHCCMNILYTCRSMMLTSSRENSNIWLLLPLYLVFLQLDSFQSQNITIGVNS